MRILVVVVAAALAAGGCERGSDQAPAPLRPSGGVSPQPAATEPGSFRWEAGWSLVSGRGPDGAIPRGERELWLIFRPRLLGGGGGCNGFSVRARFRGERIHLRGPVTSTLMSCGSGIDARERAYVAAVRTVERRRLDGNRLVLTGPSTELVFEPVPPLDAGALAGPAWTLESITVRGKTVTPTGSPARLRFTSDSRIEGETGCRGLEGRYLVRAVEVVITELAAVPGGRPDCPPERIAQEDAVLGILDGRLRAKVEGDRLAIGSPGGAAIGVFRSD